MTGRTAASNDRATNPMVMNDRRHSAADGMPSEGYSSKKDREK